ncbi:MAG: bifunctional phosphoribosyl-AMP cyclohydrolase/phosphoribosyl-ATP diphosphatase HisIE [Phaeodactylibacter sp.]|nr:bifunctional phosphoribosyl-AMP cyclohydrolase/phosphoribosyl-ATP diphosphatase HisIE [Phaeodactylibacter sp.]
MIAIEQLNFAKGNGLLPAIVQDAQTGTVLMQAYMNVAALQQTLDTKLVTFYSRSRQALWTKGSTSGNLLHLVDVRSDCDGDALLVRATPAGPVCHTGSSTCFGDQPLFELAFLKKLETLIQERKKADPGQSYTAQLFEKGPKKIAQKVGEEAVELILEVQDHYPDLFLAEAADLLYHFLVLLAAKEVELKDVVRLLQQRHH